MWLAERITGNRKNYGMNLVGRDRRDKKGAYKDQRDKGASLHGQEFRRGGRGIEGAAVRKRQGKRGRKMYA